MTNAEQFYIITVEIIYRHYRSHVCDFIRLYILYLLFEVTNKPYEAGSYCKCVFVCKLRIYTLVTIINDLLTYLHKIQFMCQ